MAAELGSANNYYVTLGRSLFFSEGHFPQTVIVKWLRADAGSVRVACVGYLSQIKIVLTEEQNIFEKPPKYLKVLESCQYQGENAVGLTLGRGLPHWISRCHSCLHDFSPEYTAPLSAWHEVVRTLVGKQYDRSWVSEVGTQVCQRSSGQGEKSWTGKDSERTAPNLHVSHSLTLTDPQTVRSGGSQQEAQWKHQLEVCRSWAEISGVGQMQLQT